jgi:hypothetical protein
MTKECLEYDQMLLERGGSELDKLYQKLMVPAAASRSVTDIQGSFSISPKCSTIGGMISATMVWSSEKRKTLDKIAATGKTYQLSIYFSIHVRKLALLTT